MGKIKHIAYGLLWIIYIWASFHYFPLVNINAAIPSLGLYGLGAWLFGTRNGLLIVLLSLPYNAFLLGYYGDVIEIYQAKALGTFVPVLIAPLMGTLKNQKDRVKDLSIELDRRVAERTEELNRLIEQLITDDEHVRRNLGQDIHDGLGQTLTGLLLYSSTLQADLEKSSFRELDRVVDLVRSAQRNLYLARKISRTLFPFKMMEAGLDAAFDELTSYFSEKANIQFETKLDFSIQDIPDFIVTHFYRIVYECILNTQHDDNPSWIRIHLYSESDKYCLLTKVEGCNSPENISNNMFVELMRYRAKLIHGELSTEISPTDDIIIRCSVPNGISSVKPT